MIARVEPLTRTRAIRGPFDYRLAPTSSTSRSARCCACRSAGSARSASSSSWRTHPSSTPSAWPSPTRCCRRACRPTWSSSRGGWRASTARRRPVRSGCCWPPGAPRASRASEVLVAELTDAGAEALERRGATDRAPAGAARAPRARRPGRRRDARDAGAAAARAPRPRAVGLAGARAAARRTRRRRCAPGAAAAAHRRPAAARSTRSSQALERGTARTRWAASCCTA